MEIRPCPMMPEGVLTRPRRSSHPVKERPRDRSPAHPSRRACRLRLRFLLHHRPRGRPDICRCRLTSRGSLREARARGRARTSAGPRYPVRDHRAEVRDDGTSPGQESTLAVGYVALCLSAPPQPAQPRSGVTVIVDSQWRRQLPYGIRVHGGPELGSRLTVLAGPMEGLAALLRYCRW
jgi:hypothetical protein